MKVAFVSNKNTSFGSFRIPFVYYRNKFNELGVCTASSIDDTTDFCFCYCGEGFIRHLRRDFPSCKFIGVKPHFESNIKIDNPFNPLDLLLFWLKIFRPLSFNPGFKSLSEDVDACDLLLADTRRLLRFFSYKNHNAYFLRLLEPPLFQASPYLPNSSESVHITYHGNPFTLASSVDDIKALFSGLTVNYNFSFHFVTNLININQKKFSNFPGSCFFYEYSKSTLASVLKKTHIGLVPEIQLFPKRLSTKVLSFLLSGISQPNADLITQKFSSNAGRAYIFAQHGIPFLASSTEEILLDFPTYHSLYGSSLSFKENTLQLKYLLTNDGFLDAQARLKSDFASLSIHNESLRFLSFLNQF